MVRQWHPRQKQSLCPTCVSCCQCWGLRKGLASFPCSVQQNDHGARSNPQGANDSDTNPVIPFSNQECLEQKRVADGPIISSWEVPMKAWGWLKGDRREQDRCGNPGHHPALASCLLHWSCQKQSSSFINKLLYHGTTIGSWGSFGRCKTGHYIYNWCSMSTARYCQLYTTLFLHFQILQAPILLLQKNDCNLKENSSMSCQSSL